MKKIIFHIRKLIPAPLLSAYHYLLALFGAIVYRFPSRKCIVVGITGTKGKSSTAEILSAILEKASHKTALLGTIRFKVGNDSTPNLYKMTMPGRFFIQKFLRKAVNAHCEYVILEMTSEGVVQHRHRFIALDALIVTNIAPEHIESHGSFEKYLVAKLALVDALNTSPKKNKTLVVNTDDAYAENFLKAKTPSKIRYSLANAKPYTLREDGVSFMFEGKEMKTELLGTFSLYNILAAATFAQSRGVSREVIREEVAHLKVIPGRAQKVNGGQTFDVVVDYAHTKESLESLYKAFPGKKLICVLGATGGGRDRWKRGIMGAIADRYCSHIILTNEDPYDEDPEQIVREVAKGITTHTPTIIMDRREAISRGITYATENSAVLITGKGTDPFIMGPKGTKEPWSDSEIAREELRKILK